MALFSIVSEIGLFNVEKCCDLNVIGVRGHWSS